MLFRCMFLLATDKVEVCPLFGEDLEIICPKSDVIVTSSARYGRMEKTRCLEVDEFIGCDNDVLLLLINGVPGIIRVGRKYRILN